MRISTIISASVWLLTGCANLPTQTGTWAGTGERTILYTINGKPIDVVVFHLERGPAMGDKSYKGGGLGPAVGNKRDQFISSYLILVDQQMRCYPPDLYAGKKLLVSGKVQTASPIDPVSGDTLVRTTPKTTLSSRIPPVIRASKSNVRVLGEARK